MGVAAFVLGLIGLLICWIPYVGWLGLLMALLGMILGGVSAKQPKNKGLGIAGAVLGTIGFLLGIFVQWFVVPVPSEENAASAYVESVPQRGAVPIEQTERNDARSAPQYDRLGTVKSSGGLAVTLRAHSMKENTITLDLLISNRSEKEQLFSTATRLQMTSEKGEMGEIDYNLTNCDGIIPPNGLLQCRLVFTFKQGARIASLRIHAGNRQEPIYFKVPTDQVEACELFREACDAGGMTGCSALGACFGNGVGGMAKDDNRACDLFKQACEGGEMKGCQNLSVCFKNGAGGLPKDKKKASELLKKACDGGAQDACKIEK